MFYSYAYPEPAGFKTAPVEPAAAFYSADFGEFVLPYDAVRQAESPDATLLDFLQSTYEAAADLARGTARRWSGTAIRSCRHPWTLGARHPYEGLAAGSLRALG